MTLHELFAFADYLMRNGSDPDALVILSVEVEPEQKGRLSYTIEDLSPTVKPLDPSNASESYLLATTKFKSPY